MLFTASTSTISNIGTISSSSFNSIAPWAVLVIGIVLGFYIIEFLIDIASQSNATHHKADRVLEESRKTLNAKQKDV